MKLVRGPYGDKTLVRAWTPPRSETRRPSFIPFFPTTPVVVVSGYVTEDTLNFYVTEDGINIYVQES